jgi:hypothetical protein
MAAGAGIAPGRIADCRLIDFAPTVLARLGQPELSAGMEGSDIFGTSVRHDPGHAGGRSEMQSAPHQPTFEYDEEEQRLIEQRLADLGYLE